MNILKKIILFLFGIALIVFGNRSAITAISAVDTKDEKKDPSTTTSSNDIIIESDSEETATASE